MHGASAFLCPQVQQCLQLQGGMSAKLLVCGSCRLYVCHIIPNLIGGFAAEGSAAEGSAIITPATCHHARSCHTCHHAMSCHAESFTEASYLLTGPVPLVTGDMEKHLSE